MYSGDDDYGDDITSGIEGEMERPLDIEQADFEREMEEVVSDGETA